MVLSLLGAAREVVPISENRRRKSRPRQEAIWRSRSKQNRRCTSMLASQPSYGCSNVSTTLGESCENVGKLSCCNIFQESFKNVDTIILPQHVVRKHLHNSMATFIHFDNIEALRYSQCCGNLSAIWENPRRSYQGHT